ncbi:MAG: hypothetical protein U0U09_14375 [Cyclobacteriaceae bacterium]
MAARSVKENPFENLPKDNGYWVVVAWGRVISTRKDKNYKIEVILRKFDRVRGRSPFDLSSFTDQISRDVNIGSIRTFSPGTVFHQRKIAEYVHEHIKKVKIDIQDPQGLSAATFSDVFSIASRGETGQLFIVNIDASFEKCPVRILEHNNKFGRVIFPCSVIADYYYFGQWRLIKAILDGRIDANKRHRNGLYDPETLVVEETAKGEIATVITLRRDMSFEDELKIARIAVDPYYRHKCLDISNGLLYKKKNDSFINTDFPIKVPTRLSVYGSHVQTKMGKAFLVHSISFCTSPMPFDGLLSGREDDFKNPGNSSNHDGTETQEPKELPEKAIVIERTGSPPDEDEPKKKPKKKTKPITEEKPLYNSVSQAKRFEKDEAFNFPKDSIVRARELDDGGKNKKVKKFKKRFQIFEKLSTDPGNGNNPKVGRLKLLPKEFVPPEEVKAPAYFDKIRDVKNNAEQHYKEHHEVSVRLITPYPLDGTEYSTFNIKQFEQPAQQTPYWYERKKFCYLKTRYYSFKIVRRVFIAELIINKNYFYLMDIEPKYGASSAVVIYSSTDIGSKFKSILDMMVEKHNIKGGVWKVLDLKEFKLPYQKFSHYSNAKASFRNVREFIDRYVG